MSRHFVVAVEPLTPEQDKIFTGFIKENGGTYWHWITNFWLLKFPEDTTLNQESIWHFLNDQSPGARIYITETNGNNWTVTDYTTNRGTRMDAWLKKHWSEKSEE